MEEAAAQKRVRQFLFVVGGDDHHRPMPCLDAATQLIDIEFHAIDLKQQVVREFDIGLVDFIN